MSEAEIGATEQVDGGTPVADTPAPEMEQASTVAPGNETPPTTEVAVGEVRWPEGFEFDRERSAKLQEFVASHKLPQEAADALVEMAVGVTRSFQEAAAAEVREIVDAWKKESRSLPMHTRSSDEVGLAMVAARKALENVPRAEDLFDENGLGAHPAVQTLLYQLGRAKSEDAIVGRPARGTIESLIEGLYPSMRER